MATEHRTRPAEPDPAGRLVAIATELCMQRGHRDRAHGPHNALKWGPCATCATYAGLLSDLVPAIGGFWDRLGLDEGGMPIHLPMGVTAAGEGPERDAAAHHYACWCADVDCPLTLALQHARLSGLRAVSGPPPDAGLDEATREALVEAIQAGTEAEFVASLTAQAWRRGYTHADNGGDHE